MVNVLVLNYLKQEKPFCCCQWIFYQCNCVCCPLLDVTTSKSTDYQNITKLEQPGTYLDGGNGYGYFHSVCSCVRVDSCVKKKPSKDARSTPRHLSHSIRLHNPNTNQPKNVYYVNSLPLLAPPLGRGWAPPRRSCMSYLPKKNPSGYDLDANPSLIHALLY